MKLFWKGIYLFLIFSAFSGFGQTIDSIRKVLKSLAPIDINDVSDTSRCNLIYSMAQDAEEGEWQVYNNLLKEISEHRIKKLKPGSVFLKNYQRYLAYAYNEIGLIYREKSDIINALEYLQKSLELNELIQSENDIGISYNNFAIVYYDIGDIDKALDYSLKSLAILEKKGKKAEVSLALTNIGYLYIKKNNYAKAMQCYKQSLDLATSINNKKSIAESYNSIGLLLFKQNLIDTALKCYEKSLSLRDFKLDKRGVATTLNNIGNCYSVRKEYKKALIYSKQAIDLSRELKNVERIRQAALTLKSIYEGLGNYKEALNMHELYIQMRDSTENESNRKAALKSQIEYEYQKREIILKEEQNKVLALYQQKRSYYLAFGAISILMLVLVFYLFYYRFKQVKEKENNKLVLRLKDSEIKALQLQMNPHFVFNTLNSVLEFIRRSEKEEALKYLSKFSKLMRILLESSNTKNISIAQELEFLSNYVDLENLRFANSFNFKLHVDKEIDIHNTEIPNLIIQPFVENAILHGLQNKKQLLEEQQLRFDAHLNVSFTKKAQQLLCVIEDNGIGRKQATEIKKNKAFNHHSIGIRLTNERLELLNMQDYKITFVDLEDAKGNSLGTRVEILLPLIEVL